MAPTLEGTVEQLARQSAARYFGKYRGVVTDNDDKQGLCRIMARVPAVMGDAEVGWALPSLPFAGDGHGQVMLPEVDSMVWIEFEAGNLDFPIWSGGFFRSGQRPDPNTTGARVVVSKSGHKVELNDDTGKLIVEHSAGAKIEMSATELSLSIGACTMVMSLTAITFNDGVLKIGPGGLSLAQGAMTLGVPPV